MVTKSKVMVEEKKYPKVTLEISAAKKAVITLNEYKGKAQLMMREMYLDSNDEFQFGKNGFNIPLSKLSEDKCERLAKFFTSLGSKLADLQEEE